MTNSDALDKVKQMSKFAKYTKTAQIINGPDGLKVTGFGTSGLDKDPAIGKSYDINNSLMAHLDKLNYSTYIDQYYDCEDRAFWGMAHLRRRLPGCRVGVASGFAPDGHPFAGQEHAVIILWYEGAGGLEPLFYDPLPVLCNGNKVPMGKVNPPGLNKIASVIAFPIGADADTVKPLAGMHRLDNEILLYDKERLIYPLRDPKKGILDYLEQRVYDTECDEIDHHDKDPAISKRSFENYWTSYDEALWAFVHVRRAYPGCAVGVAIGDFGASALSIWHEDGSGDRQHMYWDPNSRAERRDFRPKIIFM